MTLIGQNMMLFRQISEFYLICGGNLVFGVRVPLNPESEAGFEARAETSYFPERKVRKGPKPRPKQD